MFGVLLFDDNHTEDIIIYRPQSNGIHEFFTASGLYIYVEENKTFYRYHPERLQLTHKMSGGYDCNSTDCYYIDKTVETAKLHFPQEVYSNGETFSAN